MKVLVHIRQKVEVEVPDALVPTRRDRWRNQALQEFALDAALDQVRRGEWGTEQRYGLTHAFHPALGWIEYPKEKSGSGEP